MLEAVFSTYFRNRRMGGGNILPNNSVIKALFSVLIDIMGTVRSVTL